jgi:exopolysaccharide production protein ExoQ
VTATERAPVVRSIHDFDESSVSFAAFAVGFFLSFRAALVMIAAHWIRLGTEAGVIANLTVEFALMVAILFQAIGPAARPIGWLVRRPPITWVLCFLAFSCSSLLWSATVSRPASFLYWCAMASDVAVILLLLRGGRPDTVSHSLMRGFIVSTCLLGCIAWIMPASEDLRLGDPDYFNTNQIGNLCGMAVFMAQFIGVRTGQKCRLPIFFLTLTLLRTLSKATIIAFVIAEGLLMARDTSMSRKSKALIALTAVLFIAAYGGLIGVYVDAYTNTGNQAETLTGRTAIWAYTLDVSLDKPWFGNGIDAMWKVFPPFGREMFEARHAENELLQQFFAYGAIGVLMLAGVYGSLYGRILRVQKGPSRSILVAIMLFVLVRGLAEAEPFDLLLPLWMITLVSGVLEEAIGARESENRLAVRRLLIPGGSCL